MKQNNGGSFFPMIFFLLMIVFIIGGLGLFQRTEYEYSREQLIADAQAGQVRSVEITPNPETPTGFLSIRKTSGEEKTLYVTDVESAEELVRSLGIVPVVNDVKRESWLLTSLLPMLIVLVVGVFLL